MVEFGAGSLLLSILVTPRGGGRCPGDLEAPQYQRERHEMGEHLWSLSSIRQEAPHRLEPLFCLAPCP